MADNQNDIETAWLHFYSDLFTSQTLDETEQIFIPFPVTKYTHPSVVVWEVPQSELSPYKLCIR